jgi:hypothetical protein
MVAHALVRAASTLVSMPGPLVSIARETGVEMSLDAARTSVSIAFRITMGMKTPG